MGSSAGISGLFWDVAVSENKGYPLLGVLVTRILLVRVLY